MNYKNICARVLSALPQKQKQVIERRFGLVSGKRETLQKIGNDFTVTRERVRQVESEALLKLRQQDGVQDLKRAFSHFAQYLKECGGLKREDILLADLGKNGLQNHVLFLLTLGQDFYYAPEDDTVYSFWGLSKGLSEQVMSLVKELIKKFKQANQPFQKEEFLNQQQGENKLLAAAIEVAKEIEEGPLGHIGLVSWPEIKPRGVRDAVLLCLKKAGKPLHFTQIASLSGELKGEFFSKRRILPQTAHNELIRDPRFVLVGRGVYALKDWGYEIGTVRDVIHKVLQQAKEPLERQVVINQVLAQRLVKPNTILLNLNNSQYFKKDPSGKYTIKES